MGKPILAILPLMCALIGLVVVEAAECPMEWSSGFQAPGLAGVHGAVAYASSVYDDGTGAALYLAGEFDFACGVQANRIVKWDGVTWSPLGMGKWATVYALGVFDDGTGAALYVGGDFGVGRWDGQAWSPTAMVPGAWTVRALTVFDDGTGPAPYAAGGGDYGAYAQQCVAKWDGASWLTIGNGTGLFHYDAAPCAYALCVYDDGTGPALYVGGHFTKVDDVPAYDIAKWDGLNWSDVGIGVFGEFNQGALALAVFDDGRGPALYAGGDFEHAGYVTANGIARWDGQAWEAVDGGAGGLDSYVYSLAVFDDGRGPALFVGGAFSEAGGLPADGFAKWNGTTWWSPPVAAPNARTMTAFDDGNGPALYVGSGLRGEDGVWATGIMRWDGENWFALSDGKGVTSPSTPPFVFDDGSGPALYSEYWKWTGDDWALPFAPDRFDIYAMARHDDGTGPALYVAGFASKITGLDTHGIARWDGQNWSAVGDGIGGTTYSLVSFNDAAGPALYAAGGIIVGTPPNHFQILAKWDGTSWISPGEVRRFGSLGIVYSMAAFDDGRGPALYATGQFTQIGDVDAKNIVRWDGARWWPLGSGLTHSGGLFDSSGTCLAVLDDGTGPALYVGGRFEHAGGVPAMNVAKWDGQTFHAIGAGIPEADYVLALAMHDEGSGPILYAAGNHLYKWDGVAWQRAPSEPEGQVRSLVSFDDGHGPALWAGGSFLTAGGKPSVNIARWGCAAKWLPGDLDCDGTADRRDINPFVQALSDAGKYQTIYPDCLLLNADINGNGTVGFDDINPYVEMLLGGRR